MPEHSAPLLQLAELYTENKQLNEAERAFQKLLAQFPDLSNAHFKYAGFLLSIGNKNKSETELLMTLKLKPEHSAAMLALSNINKMKKGDGLFGQMEQLLESLKDDDKHTTIARMQLHYGLGKGADDLEEFKQAFEHWKEANRIQFEQCDFRVSQMLPFYAQLKTSFEQVNWGLNSDYNTDELKPIFIVGMPRSGSTMLEQMLSNHSEIETVGEVNYISGSVVPKIQKITGKPYPLGLNELNQEQLKMLGSSYLKQLEKHRVSAHYVIDKLPANFQSIGLIKMILPDAIIVDLSRNPLAAGLSIYRNYFAENEPYFCDLNEFSGYYLAYRELMQFWDKKIDVKIIEMSYEDLVTEPQKQLEQVLQRCNLTWQDTCLEFQNNPNQVLTLSANQVQQPLYKNALQHWEHYEPFLIELKKNLTKQHALD